MSSSSSSGITATTSGGVTRITGLSSGLDVDSIVSQLVTAEKAKKLNKLQQKEQLAEWKQTDYRTIISDVQTFASKYLDTTSSSSILSSKTFKQYSVTSSSSAVSATYTSAASAGSHTVTVSQLATKATLSSSASISKDIQGSAAADYSSLSGKSIVIDVDGTEHTISLSNVSDLTSLKSAINDAVGENMLTVSTNSSGYLTITAADSGIGTITLSDPSSGTSGLDALGFSSTDGAILSNRISTSDKLSEIADQLSSSSALTFSNDSLAFTINGTSFSFSSSDTLKTVISKVNSSDCGATLAYDDSSGKLVLTATDSGSGNTLVAADTSGSFISGLLGTSTAGTNSSFTIDGQSYTRSSNTATVDGVTYTLNAKTGSDTATVSLSLDVDSIYDSIKSFVDDYNTLIAGINSTLTEKNDSDYQPLTDDQKDEMTDTQITNWETKAKTGILEHDSTLTSMMNEIRKSLSSTISGMSTTMFDIGIDTGSYDEKGKLYIDEDTLKEAISSQTDEIANLFTKQSASYPGTTTVRSLTSSQASTRSSEEGLAYKLYDTIAKYTSTVRDSNSNKGILLQKAGITGDSSSTSNTLSTAITKYKKEISDEQDRLDKYRTTTYNKYSKLETYINTMNSQISSLLSYTSSSSS